MLNTHYIAAIQALLFVAGEEGLTLEQLSLLLELDRPALRQLLDEMKKQLDQDVNSGLTILHTAHEYKLATKPDFEEVIRQFAISPFSSQLSAAALETLAIIAYKQPVTRIEVDEIRGVQSSGAIQKLLLRDLIEEAGRLETPGRPKTYKTTHYFMDYFGLESMDDLPDASELFTVTQETQSLFKGNEDLFFDGEENEGEEPA